MVKCEPALWSSSTLQQLSFEEAEKMLLQNSSKLFFFPEDQIAWHQYLHVGPREKQVDSGCIPKMI